MPPLMPHQTPSPGSVIVLGGVNCDIAAQAERLTPASSSPGAVSLSAGGVGRNIAHNLALLGLSVRLAGRVGDDPLSSWVLGATAAAGVDVRGVERVAGGAPGVYVATLEAGELAVAVSDMSAVESIDGPAAGALLDRAAATQWPAWVVLDCNLQPDALQAGLDWAATRGIPVAVEPVSVDKVRRLRGLRGRITLCTPNADEAREFSADPAYPAVTTMVVTRGAAGVAVHESGRPDRCRLYAARPAHVRNVTGAGDAFLAALVAASCRGADTEEAVGWGLAAGAHTVSVRETVSPALRSALAEAGFGTTTSQQEMQQ